MEVLGRATHYTQKRPISAYTSGNKTSACLHGQSTGNWRQWGSYCAVRCGACMQYSLFVHQNLRFKVFFVPATNLHVLK